MLFDLESRDLRRFSEVSEGGNALTHVHRRSHCRQGALVHGRNVFQRKQVYSPAKMSSLIYTAVRESLQEAPDWVNCVHIPAEMRAAVGWERDERMQEKKRNDLEEVK